MFLIDPTHFENSNFRHTVLIFSWIALHFGFMDWGVYFVLVAVNKCQASRYWFRFKEFFKDYHFFVEACKKILKQGTILTVITFPLQWVVCLDFYKCQILQRFVSYSSNQVMTCLVFSDCFFFSASVFMFDFLKGFTPKI